MTDEHALKIALIALHGRRITISPHSPSHKETVDAIFVLEGLHDAAKRFGQVAG